MSEPTITDATNPEYWANRGMVEFEAESAARVAKYTLRAVLRHLDRITHNHSCADIQHLTEYFADRIRAAVGEGKGDE